MILIADQARYALAHPITTGDAELAPEHHWVAEPLIAAGLTVDTYVGNRPCWHLSLMRFDPATSLPIKLKTWSPTLVRHMLALRDKLMRDLGAGEWTTEFGALAMHWRRPLRIDEVNQLALPPPPEPSPLH